MQVVAGNEIGLFINKNKGAAGQVINIIEVSYLVTCMINAFIMQDGINVFYCCFLYKIVKHLPTIEFLPDLSFRANEMRWQECLVL